GAAFRRAGRRSAGSSPDGADRTPGWPKLAISQPTQLVYAPPGRGRDGAAERPAVAACGSRWPPAGLGDRRPDATGRAGARGGGGAGAGGGPGEGGRRRALLNPGAGGGRARVPGRARRKEHGRTERAAARAPIDGAPTDGAAPGIGDRPERAPAGGRGGDRMV